MRAQVVEEIKKNLDYLIEQNVLSNRPVVLFGASKSSEIMYFYLLKKGIGIAAILDTYKAGEEFIDRVVQEGNRYIENGIVLVASKYYEEIKAQLVRAGYSKEDVISVADMSEIRYAVDEGEWNTALESIYKGAAVRENIISQYGKDAFILMSPYKAIGDTFFIGMFYEEYIRKHGISNPVLVVVSNGAVQVAEMYGIPQVVRLNADEAQYLHGYYNFMGRESNIQILHHETGYINVTANMDNYNGLNFLEQYKATMESDGEYRKPECDTDEKLEEMAEKYGIDRGNTVIIAPYANTLKIFPENFWKDIVSKCSEKGMKVFTNSCGDSEPVIAGTHRLSCRLSEMTAVTECAGWYIGLRSGLCDLIMFTKAKKYILYTKELYKGENSKNYFGFEEMGIGENIEEIIV